MDITQAVYDKCKAEALALAIQQKEIFPCHNWIKLPVLDPNERINHVAATTVVDLLTFLTCIMGAVIAKLFTLNKRYYKVLFFNRQ